MRYAAVIERAGGSLSAHVPDWPGCAATAAGSAAVRLHIDGLRDDGTPIPEPSSHVRYVAVGAPALCSAEDDLTAGRDPSGAFAEGASPIGGEDHADLRTSPVLRAPPAARHRRRPHR